MVCYRRNRIAGGTYFFTVNLRDRRQKMLVEHIDALRDVVRGVRREIPHDRDLEAHVNYVYINPVKHGHVKRAVDWPYSTLHRYIRNGSLPADWACGDLAGEFGEKNVRSRNPVIRFAPYGLRLLNPEVFKR